MKVIHLDSLHLITPLVFGTTRYLNYYSATEIDIGDVLCHEADEKIKLYRAYRANNTKLARPVMIGGTLNKPRHGHYLSQIYLKELTPENRADYATLYEQACDTVGIPY